MTEDDITDCQTATVERVPAEVEHFARVEERGQRSVGQPAGLLEVEDGDPTARAAQRNGHSLRVAVEAVALGRQSVVQASEVLQERVPRHQSALQVAEL